MPLLTSAEAFNVSDSFLVSLYGGDIFKRWKVLKDEMKFVSEREYVSWLMDVACQHRNTQIINKPFTCDGKYDINNDDITHHYSSTETEVIQHQQQFTNLEDSRHQGKCNVEEVKQFIKSEDDYVTESQSDSTRAEANFPREVVVQSMSQSPFSASELRSNTLYHNKSDLVDKEEDQSATSSKVDTILLEEDDTLEDDGEFLPRKGNSDNLHYSGPAEAECSQEESQMEQHMLTVDRESGKGYSCHFCSFSSQYKSNVISHIRAIHQRIKPYHCLHCSYTASLKSTLNTHLIMKHSYESKYQCKKCDKYFPRLHVLQKHFLYCTSK